jgi:hypothetical protein
MGYCFGPGKAGGFKDFFVEDEDEDEGEDEEESDGLHLASLRMEERIRPGTTRTAR